MKKFLHLLCSGLLSMLFILPFSGCGEKNNEYPVYLVIGQSNASGNGRIEHLSGTPYYDAEYEGVTVYCGGTANSAVNGKLLKVSTKQGQGSVSTERFGVEVGIADYFKDKNYIAGVIKCGFDGSSINLNNTGYGSWWTEESELSAVKIKCYFEFLNSVGVAMEEFRNAGFNPIIKGAVWIQGESNANDASYENDLDTLIKRIREDLNLTNLYFVAGTICYTRPGIYSENCAVNLAVRNLKNKPNCDFVESGIYPTNAADRYHWTGTNLTDIGRLFAQKLYENAKR